MKILRYIFSAIAIIAISILPSVQLVDDEHIEVMEAYRAVLQNEKKFYSINSSYLSPDIEDFYYLQDFGDYIDSEYFQVTKFTILDMDGNDAPVIVLETLPLGNILILRYYNNIVYAYSFPFRGIKQIKKDGTFNWSSGAADNGYDKLQFLNSTYESKRLAYSESRYDSERNLYALFYINNEEVTEDRFFAFVQEQEQKEDADWHEFNADTIADDFAAVWDKLPSCKHQEQFGSWLGEYSFDEYAGGA